MNSDFEISKHATDQARERGIALESIFLVLNQPDKIIDDEIGQVIYQKKIKSTYEMDVLIRVFVNKLKNPFLVKTVYLTTKINKYQ